MKTMLFLLIAVFLLSCGCDHCDDPPINYQYTIENKSGVKVEIIPYHSNFSGIVEPDVSKKVVIENLQSHTKSFTDKAPYDGFNFHDVLQTYKVDIVFNNSKKTTYEYCINNTNPCTDLSNIFHDENNNDPNENYTITVDDFQNSTDCNGNCY